MSTDTKRPERRLQTGAARRRARHVSRSKARASLAANRRWRRLYLVLRA